MTKLLVCAGLIVGRVDVRALIAATGNAGYPSAPKS